MTPIAYANYLTIDLGDDSANLRVWQKAGDVSIDLAGAHSIVDIRLAPHVALALAEAMVVTANAILTGAGQPKKAIP